MTEPETPSPNCLECAHYHITWDTQFPYGCKAMNFKSKRKPYLEVFESSGAHCLRFEPKSSSTSI